MKIARLAPVAALALTALPLVASARADSGFTFTRVAGADRYATAAALARAIGGDAGSAVIATGEDFPDALAGADLAGATSSPLLLTKRDSLPDATRAALRDLGVHTVTLLGGSAAISDGVASALGADGYDVERIAGGNRFETAAAAAVAAGAAGQIDGKVTAIIASGDAFPDAVAAGPIAAAARVPILLTDSTKLPDATAKALSDLGIAHAVVLGGSAAVTDGVVADLEARGLEATRLAGSDRTATAAAAADWAIAQLGFSTTTVNLARGDAFADALAGGPVGGAAKTATVLSTSSETLGVPTAGWLSGHAPTLATGQIFGGPGAVSDAVAGEATTAARGGSTSATKPSIAVTSGLANGAFTSDATPTYAGTATSTASTVRSVSAAVDGAATSTDSVACSGCGSSKVTWTFTPTAPLAEGAHKLSFIAIAADGAMSSTTTSVTVDLTAPEVAGLTATRGLPTVVVAFSEPVRCATVIPSAFTATVDAHAVSVRGTACAAGADSSVDVSLTSAVNAGQQVTVAVADVVTDSAGNKLGSKSSATTTAANAGAPTVEREVGPADDGWTNLARPAWTGRAESASGAVAKVEASFEGGAYTATGCTGCPGSAIDWAHMLPTALAENTAAKPKYTIAFRAVDDAGVRSTPLTIDFTYDKTAPSLGSIAVTPGSPTVTATFAELWGVECQTVAAGDFTATLQRAGTTQVDPVAITGAGCPGMVASSTATLTLATTPSEGDVVGVTLKKQSVADRATNAGPGFDTMKTATASFPTAAFTGGLASGASTNDPRPTWSGTASATAATVQVSIVAAAGAPGSWVDAVCTGCGTSSAMWTYTPDTELLDGSRKIYVRAVDARGGTATGTPTSRTFTIDTAAPSLIRTDATVTSPGTVNAVFSEAIARCDAARFTVTINNGAPIVPDSAQCGVPSVALTLPAGTLMTGGETVKVFVAASTATSIVADAAGNTAASATVTATVT
jgi:putative cell wall-binding protein